MDRAGMYLQRHLSLSALFFHLSWNNLCHRSQCAIDCPIVSSLKLT
jgi:hypothetical protein